MGILTRNLHFLETKKCQKLFLMVSISKQGLLVIGKQVTLIHK